MVTHFLKNRGKKSGNCVLQIGDWQNYPLTGFAVTASVEMRAGVE